MKKQLIIASVFVLSASAVLSATTPKGFAEMDADKNGQIDVQEWVASAKKKADEAGKEYKEKQAMKRMDQKDTNGDKVISAEEFAAANKAAKSGDKKKKSTKED